MMFQLKRLTRNDGEDVFNMLQIIPSNEMGCINKVNGYTYQQYKEWLILSEQRSEGYNLEDWMVPTNVYWLYVDGYPVGMGKLRHRLTDALRFQGGHIGYIISPQYRGKGYGTKLLQYLVEEANKMGIEDVLLTILQGNNSSLAVAKKAGGVMRKMTKERFYITIKTYSMEE